MIVKIMKGDKNFRETTKSAMQCSNEIFIYKEVLPYLKKFIASSGAAVDSDWCPRVYFADYDVFPELGEDFETILALENLNPLGYRLGSRIDLDENHLKLMIKTIALYHAVNFALKINKDPVMQSHGDRLNSFSYLDKDGQELESYKVLFNIALERFFRVIETDPKFKENEKFYECVQKFKNDYLEHPMVLMQSFLATDDVFSIILHGDYNRNNVLFQYDQPEGYENPKAIKMIDFQETKYGTPVIDLAFFMYMNIHPSLIPKVWDSLLDLYHETMIDTLAKILNCDLSDDRLKPYGYNNFLDHFKKFAFYGVMIGIHFIPWMACPEEECGEMSKLFETDIHSPELRRLCQICGGADVDYRITSIVQHAFEKGYMEIFK